MVAFTDRLIEANRAVWAAMAGHPFVLGLARGTLPDSAIQAWAQQDRIFVMEERRVVAALRAHGLPSRLDDLLADLDHNLVLEADAFTQTAADHGFAAEAEPWPVCLGYTSYLLCAAHDGTLEGLPPCTRPSAPTWTPGPPWPHAARPTPPTTPGSRTGPGSRSGPSSPPSAVSSTSSPEHHRPSWPNASAWSSLGLPGSSWPSGRCAGAARHGRAEPASLPARAAEPGAPAGPSHRAGDRRRRPGSRTVPVLAGPGLLVPAGLRAAVRPGRRPSARHRHPWAPGRPGPCHLPPGAVAASGLRRRVRPRRGGPGPGREVARLRGLHRLPAPHGRDWRVRRGAGRAAALHVGLFRAGPVNGRGWPAGRGTLPALDPDLRRPRLRRAGRLVCGAAGPGGRRPAGGPPGRLRTSLPHQPPPRARLLGC